MKLKPTEKYIHHGEGVSVISKNKGRHQANCLCYNGCINFKPGEKNNCKIAQSVYKLDVKYNLVTPMWECPNYATEESNDNKNK